MSIVEDDEDEDEGNDGVHKNNIIEENIIESKPRRLQIVEDSEDDEDDEDDNGEEVSKGMEGEACMKCKPTEDQKIPVPSDSVLPEQLKQAMSKAEEDKKKAAILYKQSKYEDAAAILETAAKTLTNQLKELRDDNFRLQVSNLLGALHANRAACFSQANRYQDALEAANVAVSVAERNPNRGKWLLRRAQALEVLERHHEALKDMQEVQRMGIGSTLASKAVPRLRAACRSENPGRILAEKRRGNVHFKAKHYKEALKRYELAVDLATSPYSYFTDTKTTAILYTNLALTKLKLGDFSGTKEACSLALGLPGEGSNVTALRRRALASKELGYNDEAVKDLRAAVELLSLQKTETGDSKFKKLLETTQKELKKLEEAKLGNDNETHKRKPSAPQPVVNSNVELGVERTIESSSTTPHENTLVRKQTKEVLQKSPPSRVTSKAALENIDRKKLTSLAETVPRTALEANTTLKNIHADSKLVAKWCEKLAPKLFWKLFKSTGSLSMEHLCAIIHALSSHSVHRDPVRTLEVLKCLSKSSRFDLNIAMVDEKTEEAISKLFEKLNDQVVECKDLDAEAVQEVQEKYC